MVVAAAISATAGLMIWHNRQLVLDEHQRSTNSMSIVLVEQTSRYVQVIDMMLHEVQNKISNSGIATPTEFRDRFGSKEVQSSLAERVRLLLPVDTIFLLDANGIIFNWSQDGPAPRIDSSDRDYYVYFKAHQDSGLFIGSIWKARATGEISLHFARRVTGPDGTFLGVVLGNVNSRYLSDFYQAAAKDLGKSIALLRRDGTMLMRYPSPELAIGMKLPPASTWYTRVAEGGGSYVNAATVTTGIPSLVTVRLLPDYPLVIDILKDRDAVFAQWRREAVYIAAFAAAASIAFAGLFWTLGRQFWRLAQANVELDRGREQFETVLGNITQGVCFFDGGKKLQLWNRRFTEIYDLAPDVVHVGCSLSDVLELRHAVGSTPDTTQAEYHSRQEQVVTARQQADYVVSLRNGRFLSICHHPMPGSGWVSTHEDITERHLAEASIVFMARHDALTRLPNRVMFRERIEQALAMAERGIQFAVFYLDLDKFKEVNDTLGHPAGDAILVAVADRLKACVREVDTVARLGGDEFAIIQHGVRQPDDAEVLAGRIIAVFSQPLDVCGQQITVGVSIGVAVAPSNGASYESLVRDADIALYLAKTEGAGVARFFEPEMDARIQMRRLLAKDLQGAIARDELELYYQPQVDLATNMVSGFEALLRWHHPDRGFVSPADFIPLAEETGVIVAIGEWVVRTACFEAENWPADINVAVNLSPVQFRVGDIVGTVRTALAASGLRPDRLELEITESVFLGATTNTTAVLQAFREMGISVALDDFGTGYSSLSYLRSFPFNKLKIDQSFVRDLMTCRESMSIVGAVIGLGKSLGIMTIAEGVETQAQLEKLREKGCTEVQGYLFSRPRPASEIHEMIGRVETSVCGRDQRNWRASSARS
jgi:diguanylate cyclase (GGDEF)-like protein